MSISISKSAAIGWVIEIQNSFGETVARFWTKHLIYLTNYGVGLWEGDETFVLNGVIRWEDITEWEE